MTQLRNWAGNMAYDASSVVEPATVEQVQEAVRSARQVRPLGSRHSFNAISNTTDTLISLHKLDRVLGIDAGRMQVTVEGGITYGDLAPVLHEAGFALANLASLPHISVAGACATGTHGSGNTNGSLATSVVALKIVTASGEILSLDRNDDDFRGAVVSMGALGPVVELTLALVPTFSVRQVLYSDLPVASFTSAFEALSGAAYSVSFFTRWQGDTIERGVFKLRDDQLPPSAIEGATLATRAWHPIAELDPSPSTVQMGVSGPWHERLPHFRDGQTPSVGAELQSEYFVARRDAVAAFEALRAIQQQISAPLLVSEIRTVAGDNFWVSPTSERDSVAFHFTWKPDWPAVQPVLALMERALAPFGVRPHWGKLFVMPADEVRAAYPRFADFRRLVRRHDPAGKFRNAFLDAYLA